MEKWIKWTLGEAGMKLLSRICQKMVGISSLSLGHTFYAAGIVGLVQTIFAARRLRSRNVTFFPSPSLVFGSALFGLGAFAATVLGFATFYLGGDVGTSTFIVTLSIVPGALIDRYFFGHKLNPRQWLGIMTAILAGYLVLGAPSLREILNLPAWVGLAVLNMLAVAINQGITQKIKEVDSMVKNFWGGATALILGSIGLVSFDIDASALRSITWSLSLWSGVIGFIVIGMWTFNLYAYKDGAYIALKKVVLNGTYLSSAMFMGALLFGETFYFPKILGIIFYFIAFLLIDNKSWQVVTGAYPQHN